MNKIIIALIISILIILPVSTYAAGTPKHYVSAATTNATVVKNAAGDLNYIFVTNLNAATRYLKFFDKATTPSCGSDTVVFGAPVPNNSSGGVGGYAIPIPPGARFNNGISFCITATASDTANDAVGAGEVFLNLVIN